MKNLFSMDTLSIILSCVSIIVEILVAIILYKQSKSIASLSNSTIQKIKIDIHELLQAFVNLQFKRKLKENGYKNINVDYELNLIEKFRCSHTSKLVVEQLDLRDTDKEDGMLLMIYLFNISDKPESCEFIEKASKILLSIEESDLIEMEKNAKRLDDKFAEWFNNNTSFNSFIFEISDKEAKNREEEHKLISDFFIWLYDVKRVEDPDVELLYAIDKNDTDLVKKASKRGANKTVTDTTLIKRYETEYIEFIRCVYKHK